MRKGDSKFTTEEQKFIIDNTKGKTNDELTKMFNNHFNKNVSLNQIRFWKERHRITSGVDMKFKKGQKQIYTYSRPIGSEYVKYYKDIKLTYIKIANPKVWELKQNYIYKKYKGEIPKNCCVIFLDGNRDNFDPDNLELISKFERKIMNLGSCYYNDKELTETGILITRLRIKSWNKCKEN